MHFKQQGLTRFFSKTKFYDNKFVKLQVFSIKNKLTLILMATSTFAVIIVCILFYYLVALHFTRNYTNDLNTLARILGYNCQASLAFNVSEDATRILSSAKRRKSIIAILLYDKQGILFSEYFGKILTPLSPIARKKALSNNNYLKLSQDIILDDGSRIGRIIIFDNRHDITASRENVLYILLTAGVLSLLFAYFLGSLLQDIIYKPILTLTEAVQSLATGDFTASRKIKIVSRDEIGILSAAFKEMSSRLNDSYIELKQHSENLEEQVKKRTYELQHALDNLTKSQQQLVQSEKLAAIGYMVAGIAHEINNSINFISGAIPVIKNQAILLENIIDDSDCQVRHKSFNKVITTINDLLGNAMAGVNRTANLVTDLNSFAQPSRGHFTPTDIHKEIDLVILMLRYEFNDRITIKRNYAKNMPPIACLKDQMSQVYMNILLNASQAIRANGIISIKTWTHRNTANISIKDNGIGISNHIKNKIFDPFFTTKKVGEGTGLGLSIAYGIVKSHNGRLVGASRDNSTTFTITIPFKQDHKVNSQQHYSRNFLKQNYEAET